jgi:hypothetical protein
MAINLGFNPVDQFPPREIEVLPRWSIPKLHNGTDILLFDNIWEVVW